MMPPPWAPFQVLNILSFSKQELGPGLQHSPSLEHCDWIREGPECPGTWADTLEVINPAVCLKLVTLGQERKTTEDKQGLNFYCRH